MEAITIRLFQSGDAEAVTAIWSQVFSTTAPHHEPAASIQKKLAVEDKLFFVAERSQRVIGTVMGGYDGHRGWVYSLAVHPNQQGRGVGTALVRQLEQELAKLGCPKINLQVVASNDGVVAFYEKLGFQVEPRISMGKRLYG